MSFFTSDPKYVFFSYRRADAGKLIQRIHEVSVGIVCMSWDQSLLVPGLAWKPQLEKAIVQADTFVFIISPGFLDSLAEDSPSPTCAWELKCALEHEKDIVPVMWESSDNLHRLPEAVSKLHFVNFEDYRISGLTDEAAFARAWDRLMLGINGRESVWLDEAQRWYDKLDDWKRSECHPDFLLTNMEMKEFEHFLRTTPPRSAHVLDHPLMWRFIRVNRIKWETPGGSRF